MADRMSGGEGGTIATGPGGDGTAATRGTGVGSGAAWAVSVAGFSAAGFSAAGFTASGCGADFAAGTSPWVDDGGGCGALATARGACRGSDFGV